MQILNCEQGTPEWHAARLGIVTMSELKTLLVKGKGPGGFGAGALSYMHQLIGERITGESADAFSGNAHTQRGHTLEPVARELYSEATGNAHLEQVGIILNHRAGYSPDSLVGSDGLIEVKTKLPKYQIELLIADELPQEHIAQCQGGLWVSEREWIDFVSYWPGMPLFVKRAYRDEAIIQKIAERVAAFYEEMDRRMAVVIAA
ncbi:YqaJ-like recombinase domain-containing protein [Kushneria avicenniae]|uniref:YqaJ-like recombinase domain-containing protein n=2 Tax=Kushneria avicenniae TaxID=402385 RepID=A0A1I1JS70_9GAMM|nr:lambda exonuclease family protein [Kushneria avicenniae]SFC49368.1 YqaJ-like recombinase domain-containing protein [Kushneria avicenniae]